MSGREKILAGCRYSDDWWQGYLDKLNHDTMRALFRDQAVMGWVAMGVSWCVAWVVQ